MNNSKNIKMLSPFVLFCQKVIPLACDESMSYYECLCALYNYLKNDVVPAININADAITSLEEYVNNYFDNLDVQTLINNKLDEMAESGELAEIIAQYVSLNAVFGYDTISDMSDAENLINGSICRCIGKDTYNDGKGGYYKVRHITSGDTIDGYNIVELQDVELIAERLPEYEINLLNTLIEQTNTKIGNLSNLETEYKSNLVGAINEVKNQGLTEIVIFGDSWSDPTSLDAIWGTQNYIGAELNLHVDNYAKSGAYMSGTSTNDLEDQIATFNADSNVNKSKVKYIVILGGINDYRNSVTWSTLKNKIEEQIELLKGYCPQAKIIYVSNCQYYYSKEQGDYWCGVHEDIHATSKIVTYNLFGTFGREMFNTSNYFHLTQTGQKMMLSNIIATLTGGDIIYWEDSVKVTNSSGAIVYSTQRIKNMVTLTIRFKPTASQTFFTFSNPSGHYWSYYDLRFGVVGRAKEVGIINIGYNAIALDFATAPATNEEHVFTTQVVLQHLD